MPGALRLHICFGESDLLLHFVSLILLNRGNFGIDVFDVVGRGLVGANAAIADSLLIAPLASPGSTAALAPRIGGPHRSADTKRANLG